MPPEGFRPELRYHDFIRRLKRFGVLELPGRGKGSERYLIRPSIPGTTKGPACTIRCHGSGDVIRAGTIHSCLRRLGIQPEDFWG